MAEKIDVDRVLRDAHYFYINATRFDSPHDPQQAIYWYTQAVNALYTIDPEQRQYADRFTLYSDRITALSKLKTEPEPEQTEPNPTQPTQPERPNVKFVDIIGLEEAKDALRAALVYPARRPDLYAHTQSKRNVLLYGPHGCGKSLLASSVAGELKAIVMAVDLGSIYGRYYGDAEKQLKGIFGDARQYANNAKPLVMVIDEVDGLLGRRGSDTSTEARVLGILLSELDGLDKSNNNFTVMAMTNRPWDLDVGFIRRFPRRILVTLPDLESRVELFKLHTKNMQCESLDYTRLGRMYEGYNAADISQVCMDAHAMTIQELMTSTTYSEKQLPRPIKMNDFTSIKLSRKPSVSPDIVNSCSNWHSDYGS